jgi:hypothetical protein
MEYGVIVPRSQVTFTVWVQLPWLVVADMRTKPAGKLSDTTTSAAAYWLLFLTERLYVKLSPAPIVDVDAVFVISRSAVAGSIFVAKVSVLLLWTESVDDEATVAVLEILPTVGGKVTIISKPVVSPGLRLLRLQVTVPLFSTQIQVPAAKKLTKLTSAGKVSDTSISFAGIVPRLVIEIE